MTISIPSDGIDDIIASRLLIDRRLPFVAKRRDASQRIASDCMISMQLHRDRYPLRYASMNALWNRWVDSVNDDDDNDDVDKQQPRRRNKKKKKMIFLSVFIVLLVHRQTHAFFVFVGCCPNEALFSKKKLDCDMTMSGLWIYGVCVFVCLA